MREGAGFTGQVLKEKRVTSFYPSLSARRPRAYFSKPWLKVQVELCNDCIENKPAQGRHFTRVLTNPNGNLRSLFKSPFPDALEFHMISCNLRGNCFLLLVESGCEWDKGEGRPFQGDAGISSLSS